MKTRFALPLAVAVLLAAAPASAQMPAEFFRDAPRDGVEVPPVPSRPASTYQPGYRQSSVPRRAIEARPGAYQRRTNLPDQTIRPGAFIR